MNNPCSKDDEVSRQFREQLTTRMAGIEWPIMKLDHYQEVLKRNEKVVVLDVRKSLDCCYIGPQHQGADLYNVPLKDFASSVCGIPLDDYQTIVCLCVGGPMSAVAACMLRMFGYDNAYFLAGGIKGLVAISDLEDPGSL